MTFREKLQIEHPEEINEMFVGGCGGCPFTYDYEQFSSCASVEAGRCADDRCRNCWDREMPEEKQTEEPVEIKIEKENKPMKTAVMDALRDRIFSCINRSEIEDAVIDAIGSTDFDYYIEQAMDDALSNLDDLLGSAAREIAEEAISEIVVEVLDV